MNITRIYTGQEPWMPDGKQELGIEMCNMSDVDARNWLRKCIYSIFWCIFCIKICCTTLPTTDYDRVK